MRTTADTFGKIKLDAVDPAACLKGLSAAVSPSPADLAPVRPVLELKMVDPRFITETDVLSQLDERLLRDAALRQRLSSGEYKLVINPLASTPAMDLYTHASDTVRGLLNKKGIQIK